MWFDHFLLSFGTFRVILFHFPFLLDYQFCDMTTWNEMKKGYNEINCNEMTSNEMKWNEMKWNDMTWHEMEWNGMIMTKWNINNEFHHINEMIKQMWNTFWLRDLSTKQFTKHYSRWKRKREDDEYSSVRNTRAILIHRFFVYQISLRLFIFGIEYQ
jgi:hypothetical protein